MTLTPSRPALVVVDMVPFFVADNEYTFGIVANIARLADALRAAGDTIAWVLPGTVEPSPVDEELFGPEHTRVFSGMGGQGPLRSRLWHEFEVHDADLLVEKTATSAVFPGHSRLPEILPESGIDTLLITGTVTNVCCESSARDAATLGYRVVMVADANSAGATRTTTRPSTRSTAPSATSEPPTTLLALVNGQSPR